MNLHPSPLFFLPHWLNQNISPHLLLSLDWSLQHWLPWPQAFRLRLELHISYPGSPAGRWQIDYRTSQSPVTWACSSHIGSVYLENLTQPPTTNYHPAQHVPCAWAEKTVLSGEPYSTYTIPCSGSCWFYTKTPLSTPMLNSSISPAAESPPMPTSFHFPLGLLLPSWGQTLLIAYLTASLRQKHLCSENSYLTLEWKEELSWFKSIMLTSFLSVSDWPKYQYFILAMKYKGSLLGVGEGFWERFSFLIKGTDKANVLPFFLPFSTPT